MLLFGLRQLTLAYWCWYPDVINRGLFVRSNVGSDSTLRKLCRRAQGYMNYRKGKTKQHGWFLFFLLAIYLTLFWELRKPTNTHIRWTDAFGTHLPRYLIHPSLHTYPPGRTVSASRLDVCTSIWPWKICVRLHAFVPWIGPGAIIHYSGYVSDSMGWY